MELNHNEAFLNQYAPIHQQFIRFCSSKAIGWMETEDLAQEAILATLLNFSKIKDTSNLLPYMVGIVKNIVAKQHRKAKFKGNWEERVLEKLESRTGDPAIALDLHYLLKAIKEIPKEQGEAIELFELGGLSIKEIAGIQEVSTGAVKTRISRGRKRLRALLEENNNSMTVAQRLAIYASILF